MSDAPPFITFLSDYGLQDEFVGVCHGVIARRCPRARVIDLTHQISPQDVLAGALTLRDSLGFLPAGVHLAVVDPGVGASDGPLERRAVALRTAEAGHWLVGPDNGLLMLAANAFGGVTQALDVSKSRECLTPVSATFHGRDVFAPVAAALADGERPDSIGAPFDPALLRDLTLPEAHVSGDVLHAHVLSVDRFGNIALDATSSQFEQIGVRLAIAVKMEANGRTSLATRARTFAEVSGGTLLLYEDSRGMTALAVNGGSAAQMLDVGSGDEVLVRLA